MPATATMRAMCFHGPRRPLTAERVARPEPAAGQILVKVEACGVCRTDLHVFEGDLPEPKLPLVLGHEIVGRIEACGEGADLLPEGTLVGVPWLGWTCGECRYCRSRRENLCAAARFTGYTLDGGYAEYAVADARYAFAIPDGYEAVEAAPLLCAGLIGFRALRKAGYARRLGIYGFGAAAHIVAQIARHEGREVFAFTRPGDTAAQDFARELGAAWAGSSEEAPPDEMDAAVIFAPDGRLVPAALKAVAPGGRVVCAGIHMSNIPPIRYEDLWREREIVSVANLTRADGEDFMALAPQVPIRTTVTPYALEDAGKALMDLKQGRLRGAAVLKI